LATGPYAVPNHSGRPFVAISSSNEADARRNPRVPEPFSLHREPRSFARLGGSVDATRTSLDYGVAADRCHEVKESQASHG
jgi:hypothetical protein